MKQNPCRYCALASVYGGHHTISLYNNRCLHCENHAKHQKYLDQHRKYEKGEQIKSLDELLQQECVMWFNHTRHIEFIKNWQFGYILKQLKNGNLYKAIKKEED